tara:strand:- start:3204 stop:5057 length:1854 start_codon:yes stop_codon:yes gene_type:complete
MTSTNGQTCPVPNHSEPYDENEALDKMTDAAKAMGADAECEKKLNNIVKNQTTAVSAVVITPFGGGAASGKHSQSEIDNSMYEKGCGTVSVVANSMKLEEKNMSCTLSSFQQEQGVDFDATTTVSFQTYPPTQDMLTSIEATEVLLNENIKAAIEASENYDDDGAGGSLSARVVELTLNPAIIIAAAENPGLLKLATDAVQGILQLKKDLMEQNVKLAKEALEFYVYQNPKNAPLSDSSIDQKLITGLKLDTKSEMTEEVISNVNTSMKRLSETVCLETVRNTVGPGAMQDSVKEWTRDAVDNSYEQQDTLITETITKNQVNVKADGSVEMKIHGPVRGLELDQFAESQYDITVQQCSQKAVEMGKTASVEVIDKYRSEIDNVTIREGMDEIIKQAGLANAAAIAATQTEMADMIRAPGEALASAFEGAGKGIGAAVGGLGGGLIVIVLIIAAIIMGAFFLLKKGPKAAAKATGASNKTIKIVGGVIFLVLIGCLIYFWVWPKFFKKDKRYRNKVNKPAPKQRMQPVNTQSLKSPYVRVEPRFKGDRSARNLPSNIKVNPHYRSPTQKEPTSYIFNQGPKNILKVHNPSYHFQNKKEDNPVIYTNSAYKKYLKINAV